MFYKKEKEKTCPICKKKYWTLSVQMKYCTPKCAYEGRKLNISKRQKKYEKQNKLKYGLRENEPGKITLKCKYCKNKYTRYKSQVKFRGSGFCDIECKKMYQKKKVVKKKRIDDLWSLVIKLRDKNRCTYCGKTTYLNSHHIFSRSNKSVRWYIPNGITLCSGHHTLISKFSAHKTPAEFIEWIKEKNGLKWYEDLRKEARKTVDWNKEDELNIYNNLLDLKEHYEKMLERIKHEN